MVNSFRDLKVYQLSYKLSKTVYKIVLDFPRDEQFGIISQLKRASLSVPLNITEGYAKNDSILEFKRFLKMAMGSCAEVEVLIEFSYVLDFIPLHIYENLLLQYQILGKQINVFIQKLK